MPEVPKWIDVPTMSGRFCRIGNDFGTAICIDPTNGAIFSFSLSGAYPNRFVNSSLSLFVDFMAAVAKERPKFRSLTDEAGRLTALQLRERLRKLDPISFGDPISGDDSETWWSAYFWELERGLR